MTTTTFPATQKQFDFIKTLIAERHLDEVDNRVVEKARELATAGNFSSSQAGSLITFLKHLPRKESVANFEPEAGIYKTVEGDKYYRVYLGQQSGRMLAKRIRFINGEVDYMYAGAARLVVKDAVRLSLEEVGELGITTGSCVICGRRLDDPESVDRGIGPVCAEKY